MKVAWGASIPSNWTEPALGCSWQGVECLEDEHVTDLNLNGFGLTGVLPEEIGRMEFLVSLSVSASDVVCDAPMNYIKGEIPSSFGNLFSLKHLDLACNQLEGSIPPELGNLTYLTDLRLSSNSLLGSIPPELGNLTKLTDLDLSSNILSGSIPPELGNLTNLNYLWLYSNSLSGSIPKELGNLTNLYVLSLFSNSLSGFIPPELRKLTNIVQLNLNTNSLTGTIPPDLGNLTNLKILDLHSNNISGSIPPEIGKLTNLKSLGLFSNSLSSSIPPELGNLTNLKYLKLSTNSLNGSIPLELGNLTNLNGLYLFANSLSGSVPPELGNLKDLIDLDLSSNSLYGFIPPELGNLMNLDYLYLFSNSFTGSIPPVLGNLKNLNVLDLRSNSLAGSIPPELGKLPKLKELYLSSNFFSGLFDISSLKSLEILRLDLNEPSLMLWLGSSLFPEMVELGISGLKSNASFVMESLCHQMPNLQTLEANGCGLSSLPFCFNYFRFLSTILLRSNFVNEDLFLGIPNGITLLDLSDNRISELRGYAFHKFLAGISLDGNMTHQKCTYSPVQTEISVFDISGNLLSHLPDQIPLHWCGKLWTALITTLPLVYFDASNNSLGSIDFPFAAALELLDVRGNSNLSISSLTDSDGSPFVSLRKSYFVPPGIQTLDCLELATRVNNFSHVLYDPSMSNYFFCRCAPGFFGAFNDCRSCSKLPRSAAECDASNSSLVLLNGYFPLVNILRDFDENEAMLFSSHLDDPPAVICPVRDACRFQSNLCKYRAHDGALMCNGSLVSEEPTALICAEGYEGRLCTRCLPDYFLAEERECEECPTKYPFLRSNGFLALLLAASALAVLLFVLLRGFGIAALLVEIVILAVFVAVRVAEGWLLSVVLLLLVIYSAKSTSGADGGSGEGLLKSLLFYLQTLAALSPKGMFKEVFGSWNPVHELSFANLQPFGFECFHSLEFLAKPDCRLGFYLLLPVVCILVTVLVVISSELLSRNWFMRWAIEWYDEKRNQVLHLLSPRRIVQLMREDFDSGLELSVLLEFDEVEDGNVSMEMENKDIREPLPLWKEILAATVHASLFVLYVVYFDITKIVLAVFHQPDRGFMGPPYEFLLSPRSTYGWNHDHEARRVLLLGIAGLLCLVIFVPLLYLALMIFFWWRNFRRGEFHAPALWIGFLYEGFRREVYWYELVWMTRRLLLAVFLAVVPQQDIWQPTLILSLLFLSLLLHSYAKPFESRGENATERLSLIALLFNFALSQMLEPGALLGNPPEKGRNWYNSRYGGYIFLFVLNFLVLVGYALVFASNYVEALSSFVVRKMTGKDLSKVAQKLTINREQQLELEVRRVLARNEELEREVASLRQRSGFIMNEKI